MIYFPLKIVPSSSPKHIILLPRLQALRSSGQADITTPGTETEILGSNKPRNAKRSRKTHAEKSVAFAGVPSDGISSTCERDRLKILMRGDNDAPRSGLLDLRDVFDQGPNYIFLRQHQACKRLFRQALGDWTAIILAQSYRNVTVPF